MTTNPPQHQVDAGCCPGCGALLDGAASPFDPAARPQPGDMTICTYCATLLSFGAGLQLVPADLDALAPDEVMALHRMQQTVRAVIADRAARERRAQEGEPPVTDVFAFLADNDGDGESVVAMRRGDTWLPMVATRASTVDKMRAHAQQIATATGKPVRLARFSGRVDLDVFAPAPKTEQECGDD